MVTLKKRIMWATKSEQIETVLICGLIDEKDLLVDVKLDIPEEKIGVLLKWEEIEGFLEQKFNTGLESGIPIIILWTPTKVIFTRGFSMKEIIVVPRHPPKNIKK